MTNQELKEAIVDFCCLMAMLPDEQLIDFMNTVIYPELKALPVEELEATRSKFDMDFDNDFKRLRNEEPEFVDKLLAAFDKAKE